MSLRTPLRICYIVPGFPAHASDWFTPAVAETILCIAGQLEARVVTLRYPEAPGSYERQGVPVTAVGNHGIRTLWRGVRRVMAAHRRQAFDVLHAFWATEAGFVGALSSRVLEVPLLVSCLGGELIARRDIRYGDWRSRRTRLMVQAALNQAHRIIVGSRYQMARLEERKKAWTAKAVQIPHGVDTVRFQPDNTETSPRPFTILHVAGLIPIKNHRLLFRALAKLQDRSWRLQLIGDGPLRNDLRIYARSLGIIGRIDWQGWVHHHDMPERYRQADLLALTSDHEDHCVSVLEGMACGLPVVATAVGLVPELVETGRNGVCVPRGDHQALADGIAAFLDHPDRCRTAGDDGRRRIRDYERTDMAARLVEEYRRLCK